MQRSSIVFGFSITPFEKLVKLNPTSSTILYMCAWGGRCVHVCEFACVCVYGGGGGEIIAHPTILTCMQCTFISKLTSQPFKLRRGQFCLQRSFACSMQDGDFNFLFQYDVINVCM